jgi:hypothetical protein
VYDLTDIVSTHVGGIEFLQEKWKEAEEHYHFHSGKAKKKWKEHPVGKISNSCHCNGCPACFLGAKIS